MSLWTPDGERPVRREPAPDPAGAPEDELPSFEDLTPEEQAQAQAMMAEMAEVQERIAQTPAAEVLANHLMGFYELAAIHLSQQPPHFEDAALAIDALAVVLQHVGDRIGENGPVLHQALQQVQMAFVQLKERETGPSEAP